jgi:hypothetical protein
MRSNATTGIGGGPELEHESSGPRLRRIKENYEGLRDKKILKSPEFAFVV